MYGLKFRIFDIAKIRMWVERTKFILKNSTQTDDIFVANNAIQRLQKGEGHYV